MRRSAKFSCLTVALGLVACFVGAEWSFSVVPSSKHGLAGFGSDAILYNSGFAWPNDRRLSTAPFASVSTLLAASMIFTVAASASRILRRASDSDFATFSNKLAFLFPGQGAQTVGMCKDLAAEVPQAKEMFSQASDILGYDLLDRCVNGPKESLDSTAISQPAIFVASMAAVEKLRLDGGAEAIDAATVAMGLSLGEYSALCFAGAMSFEDGVRITKARGEAMQAAADAVESTMVSVVGLDSATTEKLCSKASELSGKQVQIANYLCNGNYTVSGDKAACAKLVEIAKPEFKAKMAVPLAVAGAFHTDFMAPAVPRLRETLQGIQIQRPRIPVVSNVDAKPHSDPDVIKEILAKQVTSPVLWEMQMQNMISSGTFEQAYELGPGKVIAGIMKRIDKNATITSVSV
jgi:[acyl-carrier-protein] S-malonyltransferase